MWVLTGLEMEMKGQERGAACFQWQKHSQFVVQNCPVLFIDGPLF